MKNSSGIPSEVTDSATTRRNDDCVIDRCEGCSELEARALGPRNDPRKLQRGLWASQEEEDAWLRASIETHEGWASKLPGVSSTTRANGKKDPKLAIPKIIHQIWLGSERPSSSKYKAWFDSWIVHHPDWNIMWWHDDEVQAMKNRGELKNAMAFDAAQNYGEKSDILRYELLLKYGGLYVDTDMECLASFNELHKCESDISFYAGWSNTATIEVNNGIFGSVPGHPILKKLVQAISDSHAHTDASTHRANTSEGKPHDFTDIIKGMNTGNRGNNVTTLLNGFLGEDFPGMNLTSNLDKSMSTISRTGPGLFTRTVLEYILEQNSKAAVSNSGGYATIFPCQAFYPVPNTAANITPSILSSCTNEEVTMAVHHWAKSWQTKS